MIVRSILSVWEGLFACVWVFCWFWFVCFSSGGFSGWFWFFGVWSPSQHFCFLKLQWGVLQFKDRFLISVLCVTLVLYLSVKCKSICRIYLVIFFVDFAFFLFKLQKYSIFYIFIISGQVVFPIIPVYLCSKY